MLDKLDVKQDSKPESLSASSTSEGMAAMSDALGDLDSSKVIYGMRHGQTSLDVAKRCDGWVDLDLSDEGEQGVLQLYQIICRLFRLHKSFHRILFEPQPRLTLLSQVCPLIQRLLLTTI